MRMRMIGAAVIALACVLVGAGLAHAAQYRVTACGATANYVNHLFSASTSDNRMNAYTACPNDGNGHPIGVAASAGIERGKVPVFWNATQSFVAPAGTTIHHVHVKAEGRTWNGDWTSLLQASNDRFGSSLWNLSGCGGNPGSVNGCVSAADKIEQNYDIPGATGVRTLVSCGNFNGCTTFSTDVWPFTRAYYYVRDFDVTLDDPSVPSVSVTGGALASGKWTHGTQGLSFGATDNSGILRTQFSVDDLGTIASNDRSCDYTFAVPCSNVTNGWYEFDTNRLADGPHRVAAVAVDATDSNVASVAQTIYVDNHAPAEPVSPSVVGGEGWHNVDGFTVNWTNPPSAAPIERATYELCKSDGSGCITGSATGTGVHQISNVRVGQPGDYTIRVWLTDAAENESPAKTAPLHLKFDNVPPAQAAPQHRNGWVSASEAKSFDQEIDPPVGGAPPVSGIAGYAVTSDGSVPGWETNTRASDADNVGHRHLENLPEGVTTVRARAISGSGVGSPDVGSTDIHVDLSAPHVTVEGQPEPNRWSQRAAALRFTAVEDGLSGMASGPDDRGAESGGFIELSVDGAAAQRRVGPRRDLDKDGILEFVPTATIDLPITADGLHAVSYRAVDVAGNEGAEKSVGFKIDQTPPELAVFEAQQQSDPQLVTVAASDRTSGLADGGRIQLRRIEPNRGAWITLRTTRQDDRYYAHLENATLPEGDYQFRATIPDQAGNEATAVNDREGREEVLHITPTQVGPYPTGSGGSVTPPTSLGDPQDAKATVDTVIAAAAVQKTVTRKKCKSRSRGKKCTRVTQSLVHDLRVGFGKRAMVKGRLTTSAGTGIAGAEITVLARPAMAGGTYTAEGTVRTNGTGEFAYTAPVGPGRALDFHFRGDDTYKHADDQVTLRVPASVSIKVNRHTVRNGKRVRFTGRLQGKPYPPKGKILDLQAFYRHRWRTFATPRAALNGKWTYNYRFQATRGTVLYKFRVRVRATSDYPYELGYSKATDVRVVGR